LDGTWLSTFGGPQTDFKLDVLRQYLAFFTTVLKRQDFELWYIDGFAGTGQRLVERIISHEEPLWRLGPPVIEHERVPGSSLIALETSPRFDRFIFIEKHQRRYRALEALCRAHPDRDIDLRQGDANALIKEICRTTKWRGPGAPKRGIRAVLFLDPYGMNVEFDTLKTIRDTRAIDVWYLFSLSGIYRQAARSKPKLTPAKREAITRILGTAEWEEKFYADAGGSDLFGGAIEGYRTADVDAIEAYVRGRLATVFPKVTNPLRLHNAANAPIFSLFFAMSNPDPSAIGLAMRGANHILKAGISSQVRPRN
jgi:three-Cys-motif partner protein